MVAKYIEDDQTATDFALYVRRSGGTVTSIKQLRQGYEFGIKIPPTAKPGWGTRVMKGYMDNPEGNYVDVATDS